MSIIEIHGCDLKLRQFTSVDDGVPAEGKVTCESSKTGKALLKTDSSGKILFCDNKECLWNNELSKRIKGDRSVVLRKEMVSDFT